MIPYKEANNTSSCLLTIRAASETQGLPVKLRAASERGAASETQKEGLPIKLTIRAASETHHRNCQ